MVQNISKDIEITIEALKANHFNVKYANDVAEAKAILLEMILQTSVVGVADSGTLRQIGILEELIRRGNRIINPFTRELTQDKSNRDCFVRMTKEALDRDVFITGCNAVTKDGKVVSIDYSGNRVAGSICGGEEVILTVGRNKIVPTVEEALHRIKNVIAPFHAKWKGRKTPCAVTGKCTDCNSPERICNVTIILEKKPALPKFSIVLINQDLGLGWDPSWDEKRINEIKSNYYQNAWAFFDDTHKKP
jgi:hypothetical protein